MVLGQDDQSTPPSRWEQKKLLRRPLVATRSATGHLTRRLLHRERTVQRGPRASRDLPKLFLEGVHVHLASRPTLLPLQRCLVQDSKRVQSDRVQLFRGSKAPRVGLTKRLHLAPHPRQPKTRRGIHFATPASQAESTFPINLGLDKRSHPDHRRGLGEVDGAKLREVPQQALVVPTQFWASRKASTPVQVASWPGGALRDA